MSFRSKYNLDAKIFKSDERKRVASNVPIRSAREMRNSLRRKSLNSRPTGRIERYEDDRSRGRGFQRSFRRSARGQRFANETLTLLNAYDAKRTGDNSAIVEIKDSINPRNGANAKDYGARLQEVYKRQVMTEDDVKEAEDDYRKRSQNAHKELIS